jgi:hypothetical protein
MGFDYKAKGAPLGQTMGNPMWVKLVDPLTGALGGSPRSVFVGGGANDNDPVTQITSAVVNGMDPAMQDVAGTFQNAMGDSINGVGSNLASTLQYAVGSIMGGGGGGLLGGLLNIGMSLIPGVGAGFKASSSLVSSVSNTIASNPGIFKEGGLSTRPVSRRVVSSAMYANVPHYAEGTANTSGIPAMLHDNEAVIPLSRGRKVPVEINDNGKGRNSGRGGTVINNNFNIQTPNADSFRKSRNQVATDMHMAAGRSFSRDHG